MKEHFIFWRSRKQEAEELFSAWSFLLAFNLFVKQQRALLSSLAHHAFELEIHCEPGQGLANANDHSLNCPKCLVHTAMQT